MAKWRKGKSDRKIREKKKSDNPFVKKKGDCECALHIVVFFFTNDYHLASEYCHRRKFEIEKIKKSFSVSLQPSPIFPN